MRRICGRSLTLKMMILPSGRSGGIFHLQLYVLKKLRIPERLEIPAKGFFIVGIAFAAEDARFEGVACGFCGCRKIRCARRRLLAGRWRAACALCGASCGSAGVTDSVFGESESEDRDNDPESADADGPARRFFCVVAGELAAKDRKNTAIQVTRNAKTPNGKQTLL